MKVLLACHAIEHSATCSHLMDVKCICSEDFAPRRHNSGVAIQREMPRMDARHLTGKVWSRCLSAEKHSSRAGMPLAGTWSYTQSHTSALSNQSCSICVMSRCENALSQALRANMSCLLATSKQISGAQVRRWERFYSEWSGMQARCSSERDDGVALQDVNRRPSSSLTTYGLQLMNTLRSCEKSTFTCVHNLRHSPVEVRIH